jgi:hypothetical protein
MACDVRPSIAWPIAARKYETGSIRWRSTTGAWEAAWIIIGKRVGCGALIKLLRDHFRRRWTAGATPIGCGFNRQKQRLTHTRSYPCALRLCYTVSIEKTTRLAISGAECATLAIHRYTARSRLHPPTVSAALRGRKSFTTPVCVSLPTTVKRRRLADRDRSDRHLTHKGGMS